MGSPCPSKHKNFMRHHPPPTPQHTHRPDYLTGSQAEQETKILPGQRECREPWTLRVSRADSISPLHGSAQQFPQLCLPPLQNRPGKKYSGTPSGWRKDCTGFLLPTCFLGLPPLLSPLQVLQGNPGAAHLPSCPQSCCLLGIFLRSGLAVPFNRSQEALTPKSIFGRPGLQG